MNIVERIRFLGVHGVADGAEEDDGDGEVEDGAPDVNLSCAVV